MQEPESIMSPTGRSAPPKRKRRERTVYSKEQSEALKEALLRTEYPSYRDRLRLAARLHLDEHRVQVWFKNRPGLVLPSGTTTGRGRIPEGQRCAQGPRSPLDPRPALESATAAASPSFPGGPGFYSRPPPPSPAGVLPGPEPGVSSHQPAAWVPAQGVHVYRPAAPTPAPAPAPGWPQDPYAPNYRPDPLPVLLPDCALMFSSQELSSPTSGYQTGDSFGDDHDTGPRQFTNS